jgi:Ni/Fe-hydrogenase subunit HybB-like protein
MWLERFLIVVPPLERKYLPYDWGSYIPTWTEVTITAGTFTGMILLYVLFAKFVPMISIWELKGGKNAQPLADQAHSAVSRPEVQLGSTLPAVDT